MTRGIKQKLLLIGIATGLLLLSSKIDAADKWTNISQDTGSFGIPYDNVSCCYDSTSERIYATWEDNNSKYLRSAYYDGSTWTNISQDTSSFGSVYYNVNCCYDSASERIYAIWVDRNSKYLRSAYYDGSTWTSISQDTSSFGRVYNTIFCCYDSTSERIYATWSDNNSYLLRSAYYDGSSWTNISQDTSSFNPVGRFVHCCYDSASGRIYATWEGFCLGSPNSLRSAYYDGSTWTNISQNTGSFGRVYLDVSCCYDSDSGRIYATWTDSESPYSFRSAYYDGSTWNNISQDTSSFGNSYDNVACCYDSTSERIYATWTDNNSYFLRSAYYDGSTWTNISQDTSSFGNVYYNVNCCYDSASGRIYATWMDGDSPYTLRSAYYSTKPDTNPLSLTGIQKCNNFAVVSEQFNILSWKSLSPQASSYRLERNGVTIGPPLRPEATSYEDHNRISKIADTYRLTALDALGNPIATDTITIKGE